MRRVRTIGKKVLILHEAFPGNEPLLSNKDMELDKFDRQLRLLVLLTTEHSLSVDDISRKLDMSRRSIYRYIDAFRALGFNVRKVGTRYSIDCDSPFFVHISNQIHFSQDEAAILARLLSERYDPTPAERALREKLASLYEVDALRRRGTNDALAANLAALFLLTGAGETPSRPACVIAEGSTFHKGKLFSSFFQREMEEFVSGFLHRTWAVRKAQTATLVGAAAAALWNSP